MKEFHVYAWKYAKSKYPKSSQKHLMGLEALKLFYPCEKKEMLEYQEWIRSKGYRGRYVKAMIVEA